MRCPTWIWVVLSLAWPGSPGVAALPFTPWAAPIALPEPLRGKAVWSLCRLPDARLAVGFEGGIALGVPGGDWAIVATPNGSPVQTIAPGHGRLFAAGGGCAGFVENGRFEPLAGPAAATVEAEAVPEGWVLATKTGCWLLEPAGAVRALEPDSPPTTGHPTLGRIGPEILALQPGRAPAVWRGGRLVPFPAPAGLPAPSQLRGGLWFGPLGVFDLNGQEILPARAAAAVLDSYSLLGAVQGQPWAICATYRRGLLGYPPGADTPEWSWAEIGNCYALARDGDTLLLGTAQGAFGLADPNSVRIARFGNAEILHCQAEAAGVRLVTLAGLMEIGEVAPGAPDLIWPETDGATVAGHTLFFRQRAYDLPTLFINGLAVAGDLAAVAFNNTLVVTTAGDPVVAALPSGGTSLAIAEGRIFVGTQADGVQIFDTQGQPLGHVGTGRAKVRALAPGDLRLLFWNGEVRDARQELRGRPPLGNPRDAATVSVRRGDGAREERAVALLVTRPDGPPVVGCLDQDGWRPLDLPGLAEIDAETMAATTDRLFVAGRHGALEFRFPLPFAANPTPNWHWEDRTAGGDFFLSDNRTEQAYLVPGRWEAPSSTPPTYRVCLPSGAWTEARGGVPFAIPAQWGENHLVLQAERHGLTARRELVVVRPYPLALQPWALALEAVMLAASVWGVARWRTRHLLRQKKALEAAVEQRTAQLSKANAAKEEFLASVSHEIRNPLNGVVGICAILQDSSIGPRERSLVQTLTGCAEQLRSMLDDVLDFSRIERGEIALTLAPFEIRALVEESVRVMDPTLEACTLDLPDTAVWLEGDAGKIRQIVCNLVSNALKYGRPREAGITLRLTPEPPQRQRLRLAVHNTGPTISAEELPRLFESFRRGSSAAGAPGFGLGLAVCRRLAERMGGWMTAVSHEGATEFALELVLPAAGPTVARDLPPVAVSRALAVEDEDFNRLALGHVLRSLGYEIDWATDGASALQLARKQPYDLILTDWKLPDIAGDELCRQLLAILPPPRPPVVAVTAYSSAEKLAAARAAGMAGFVTKPVTREKLEQLIRNLDTGPRPRPALEVDRRPERPASLALLGELAPTLAKLSVDLAEGWQRTEAQARLRDPRTGRAAHGLRSLLLLAGEEDLAEQFGLLETAADTGDWDSVERLLPFLAEEMRSARSRLAPEP